MPGSFEEPPIIVKARPLSAMLAVAASGVMDALLAAAALIAGAKVDVGVVFFFVFFSLGAGLGLWMLMAPARLEVGPRGVAERVLGRTKVFAWSEVYDFRPAMIGLSAQTVGFSFTAERPGRSLWRRLSVALSGVQESLNAGWEMDPPALARLLNESRDRWLEGGSPTRFATPETLPGCAGARMNRSVFAACASMIVAAAMLVSLIPHVDRAAWIVALLFGVRFYAARLHDIGRSGWWQIGLYAPAAAAMSWSFLHGGSADFAFGVAGAVQFAVTAALCAVPGQPEANAFGPAPGRATPLEVAEGFR